MMVYLLVFVGSGLGGVTRFVVGKAVQLFWRDAFPLPTLLVNISACLVLGFVAGKLQGKLAYQTELQMLLLTGFCGGFSTFSTFSQESLRLLQAGSYVYFGAYTAASVLLCLLGVFGGMKLNTYI